MKKLLAAFAAISIALPQPAYALRAGIEEEVEHELATDLEQLPAGLEELPPRLEELPAGLEEGIYKHSQAKFAEVILNLLHYQVQDFDIYRNFDRVGPEHSFFSHPDNYPAGFTIADVFRTAAERLFGEEKARSQRYYLYIQRTDDDPPRVHAEIVARPKTAQEASPATGMEESLAAGPSLPAGLKGPHAGLEEFLLAGPSAGLGAGLEEGRLVIPSFWKVGGTGIKKQVEKIIGDSRLGKVPSMTRHRMRFILQEILNNINEHGYLYAKGFRTAVTYYRASRPARIVLILQDETARYQLKKGQTPRPFQFTQMPPPPKEAEEWSGIVEEHLRLTGEEGGIGTRIIRGYLDEGQFTLRELFDTEVGNWYILTFPLKATTAGPSTPRHGPGQAQVERHLARLRQTRRLTTTLKEAQISLLKPLVVSPEVTEAGVGPVLALTQPQRVVLWVANEERAASLRWAFEQALKKEGPKLKLVVAEGKPAEALWQETLSLLGEPKELRFLTASDSVALPALPGVTIVSSQVNLLRLSEEAYLSLELSGPGAFTLSDPAAFLRALEEAQRLLSLA